MTAELLDDDDIEAMLDECESKCNHLTDYERSFIDGCQFVLGMRPTLHEWRLERLTQIYNKVKDLV